MRKQRNSCSQQNKHINTSAPQRAIRQAWRDSCPPLITKTLVYFSKLASHSPFLFTSLHCSSFCASLQASHKQKRNASISAGQSGQCIYWWRWVSLEANISCQEIDENKWLLIFRLLWKPVCLHKNSKLYLEKHSNTFKIRWTVSIFWLALTVSDQLPPSLTFCLCILWQSWRQ